MVGTTYLRRSLWYLNCLFYRAHQARYCTERYGILVFDLIENIESVRRVVQLSPSFPSSVKVEIDPFSDRGETNDDHFEGENDVSPLNNSGNLEKEESRRKTWTSFRVSRIFEYKTVIKDESLTKHAFCR